ncbi:MAG: efflux RND transporter periplasmic adaptor subunit [Tannerella sp.]|jgi:RND family efflux transporter MFP subunit|nr:efflux RND transporter periplasmic adaptor subunit [Tannerella sp.]
MERKFLSGLLIASIFCSCGQKSNNASEGSDESIETVIPEEETEVGTEALATKDFDHELVSNGRISSGQMAELKFLSSSPNDVPVSIFVKNGDRVSAGDAIAMLDTFQLSSSYRQAFDNLQKAYLDLQDVLIGQGYSLVDSASIPKETIRLAYIRSGYNNSKIQFDIAEYNLKNAVLRTPVSGIVANLFAKTYCAINTSEPFCTVINESKPEVDFKILENELPLIKTGDKVKIQSYASPDIESVGSIASINPSVDKEGTVRIKALIQPHPNLFHGMNVRISVFRSLGKHWVTPKAAVVLRTGRPVVFTYNDGKAGWHYVKTGLENATHCTVTSETLKEGDLIIVSGNEHLADGTEVKKLW